MSRAASITSPLLLQATDRPAEAEPLYTPGFGDRRGELRAGPSECREGAQQPRPIAASHQPAGRGGTARCAGPWRSPRRASGRTIPMSRSASITSPNCCRATNRLGRGGAADAPGFGDRRDELRTGPSQRRDPPQQPRVIAANGPTGWPRPNRSCAGTLAIFIDFERKTGHPHPHRDAAHAATTPAC